MADPKTSYNTVLLKCPACQADIMAQMTANVEIEFDKQELVDESHVSVPATVKLTGCRVAHDCLPKVTR